MIVRTTAFAVAVVALPLLPLREFARCASSATPKSTRTFDVTGEMTTPRFAHTATLLTNGKVLIAGGATAGEPALASAELYDPVARTFTATGNMSMPRRGHSATLLADGSVLIAGGTTPREWALSNALASAELYDPVTGIFTTTGSMIRTRSFPTATLLNNGKVLITGGAPAEVYDPIVRAFAPTGGYAGVYGPAQWAPDPPYVLASRLLADGHVLLATSTGYEARKELYDPGQGMFSAISPPGCDSTTATLLTNGNVLLAGAGIACFSDAAELYDSSTGTITSAGNMTTARDLFTATLVPNGTVLITGGLQYPSALASAELFDPVTRLFFAIGDMTVPRFGHTATLLPDGRILIAGGASSVTEVSSSAEIYTPASLMSEPVLFTSLGGQGAILHAGTTRTASSSDPAFVGDALEIYCSGLIDGSLIPPQVVIGGRMAEILYFGRAPGYPYLNQVNVTVPRGVSAGAAISVRLIYLGRSSNGVTIAVE